MIVRHEFLGSRFYVVLLCAMVIEIPLAVIYVIQCLVTIVEDVENPTEFLDSWKSRHQR